MSKNKKDVDGHKIKQEKYMWLGFGNYSGGGVQGPINPGNVRAAPGIFDKLFELFGLKEKNRAENKEDSEKERDPDW